MFIFPLAAGIRYLLKVMIEKEIYREYVGGEIFCELLWVEFL